MIVIPGIDLDDRQHSHVLQQPLAARRSGIMLHYDDSSRDDWALEWFNDSRCTNGYTWLALDDGKIVELADPGMRTPHAGPCKTKNANSAYYGIAAATDGLTPVTVAQLASIERLCAAVIRFHNWVNPPIVGHDEQAIWTSAYTKNQTLWGRTGRKVDPIGQRKDKQPIIDLSALRSQLSSRA